MAANRDSILGHQDPLPVGRREGIVGHAPHFSWKIDVAMFGAAFRGGDDSHVRVLANLREEEGMGIEP